MIREHGGILIVGNQQMEGLSSAQNLGFLRLRFPSLGKDAWVPQKWMDLVVRARHGFDPSTGRTCRWICSLLEKEVPKKVKAESEREAGGGKERC